VISKTRYRMYPNSDRYLVSLVNGRAWRRLVVPALSGPAAGPADISIRASVRTVGSTVDEEASPDADAEDDVASGEGASGAAEASGDGELAGTNVEGAAPWRFSAVATTGGAGERLADAAGAMSAERVGVSGAACEETAGADEGAAGGTVGGAAGSDGLDDGAAEDVLGKIMTTATVCLSRPKAIPSYTSPG
jgi:hypothetical protein